MTSMLFGLKSSPCSALYIKNRNAGDFQDSKPFAAKSIERDSYMDNYIVSVESGIEGQDLIRDVIKINKATNFEMHAWASNSEEILKEIYRITLEKDSNNFDFDKDKKVLGLLGYWVNLEPEFRFFKF